MGLMQAAEGSKEAQEWINNWKNGKTRGWITGSRITTPCIPLTHSCAVAWPWGAPSCGWGKGVGGGGRCAFALLGLGVPQGGGGEGRCAVSLLGLGVPWGGPGTVGEEDIRQGESDIGIGWLRKQYCLQIAFAETCFCLHAYVLC